MLIKYDKIIDAKYITFLPTKRKRGVVAHTKKVRPWLLVDYDKDGNIFGIEILNASKNNVAFVLGKVGSIYPVTSSARIRTRKEPKERVVCV